MSDMKKSSHLGVGLLIGAAIGVASAVFLQSKKGKTFTKDLQRKVMALQKKVNAELKKQGTMNKEKYEQLVDTVVAYYVKTKDIAKTEIPEVKKSLLASWKTIQQQLKSVK
jgi:gas vesicle protein